MAAVKHNHDSRNSIKLSTLIKQYSAQGYGIYWCILEMINSKSEKCFELNDVSKSYISDTMIVDLPVVNAIIYTLLQLKLLYLDNNHISATKKKAENTGLEVIKQPKILLEYAYFNDMDFTDLWIEFLSVKKKKKASITTQAQKRQLNKLDKFTGGDISKAKEILIRSIDAGWSDLYELEVKKNGQFNTVLERSVSIKDKLSQLDFKDDE